MMRARHKNCSARRSSANTPDAPRSRAETILDAQAARDVLDELFAASLDRPSVAMLLERRALPVRFTAEVLEPATNVRSPFGLGLFLHAPNGSVVPLDVDVALHAFGRPKDCTGT